MESLLSGLPGCCVYLDDILVSGVTEQNHFENLHCVLAKLQENGLVIKRHKFSLLLDEIDYLGHRIFKNGIAPTPNKLGTLQNLQTPANVKELQCFLGFANFMRKFVPNFADIAAPLYKLLHRSEQWNWKKAQDCAFQKLKSELSSERILQHYDISKDLVLQTDASSIGLGAALF
ncbi:Uncharacterised protein r2_g822 [Pycnogonum litorale]